MNATIWSVVAGLISIIIGLWKFFGGKKRYKQGKAEEAKKDVDKANSEDGSVSDLLDGFGKL